MVIKSHRIFLNTLLILLSVVYTLLPLKERTFAWGSDETGRTAAIEATAYVDKNEVTIGDRIKFSICVKYKGDITVQFPELNQQLGVFSLKQTATTEGPKHEKDGYSTVERRYALSSYEIGRQIIPSLKIKYKDTQGEGEVATDEITIDIKGVLKEGETVTDIKDILPPMDVPTNFRRLILWCSVGLAVLSLAGSIYWIIRKRKKGQKRQEQEFIKRTPHEIAYELLERLSKEDLISKGLIKEYYYRITDIVRHYLEDRFGLLAPERTTEEFLIEMAHTNKLEDNHKLLIREFLERCDMVKYAKYGPSHIEIKETCEAAKRLIDETREPFVKKEVVMS